MEQLKHFSHKHSLSLIEVCEDDKKCCPECMDIVYGPAYACETCHQDVLHKSCAELPLEIQRDALHPHPFRLSFHNVIVCDRCGRLSASICSYRCTYCVFNLDFKCAVAFLNDDELANHEALREGRRIKTTIHHFSHNHPLTRFTFSLPMTKFGIAVFNELWKSGQCLACKQELQGSLNYTCLPCQFVLHESCLNDMPRQVRSAFHPQHILLPRAISKDSIPRCCACREKVKGISFCCKECDVNLHVSCAKYQTRTIKHDCHPHHLLHLGTSITTKISCYDCGEDFGDSFICIECDFRIHVECISLPPLVEHVRHLHPLVLINSFVEDDSGDYYCDMCETERNSEHHVYCCEECTYIAHIDCVVPEVEPVKEMFLDRQLGENLDKRLELEMESDNEKTIFKDVFHPHPLTLNNGPEDIFVCDGCGELCCGISYCCSLCLFNLDTKCIALDDDLAKQEAKKGREIKNTVSHFSHGHPLSRCKIGIFPTELYDVSCKACKKGVYGLIYICLGCQLILHESCLKDMPRQVQSPFHPEHPLAPFTFAFNGEDCHICNDGIEGFAFGCLDCYIWEHCSCAMYQTREIKHNCHDHSLLHLGKNIFVKTSPRCNACGANCSNTLFCCIECSFHIHLECIPLPYKIKHIRHLHPLTLMNPVVEDNSGKYYCDICETERNPEHDVYYCEECNYIAHIDCVISEVEPPEEIFEHLIPRPRKKEAEVEPPEEIFEHLIPRPSEEEPEEEEAEEAEAEEAEEN